MFPKPVAKPRDPRQRGRLQRKARLRARPKVDPPHVRAYLAWVRKLTCRALLVPGHRCSGRMTAHHAGRRPGIGMKCSYLLTIPLCWGGHLREVEVLHGPFVDWSREEMRAWEDEQIREVQLLAIPDGREQAMDFEVMGLGTWDDDASAWTPCDPATTQLNRPTTEGRAVGAALAKLADDAIQSQEATHGPLPPRCRDCAFKGGTVPNGCPSTVNAAMVCVIERDPFFCHESIDGGQPTRLCRGWVAMVGVDAAAEIVAKATGSAKP